MKTELWVVCSFVYAYKTSAITFMTSNIIASIYKRIFVRPIAVEKITTHTEFLIKKILLRTTYDGITLAEKKIGIKIVHSCIYSMTNIILDYF